VKKKPKKNKKKTTTVNCLCPCININIFYINRIAVVKGEDLTRSDFDQNWINFDVEITVFGCPVSYTVVMYSSCNKLTFACFNIYWCMEGKSTVRKLNGQCHKKVGEMMVWEGSLDPY
jgi:hypothetical protein